MKILYFLNYLSIITLVNCINSERLSRPEKAERLDKPEHLEKTEVTIVRRGFAKGQGAGGVVGGTVVPAKPPRVCGTSFCFYFFDHLF